MKEIALLGSYLPRQCGIATFSADLVRALSDIDSNLTIDSIAMSDCEGYVYPGRVRCEIPESDSAAYGVAAEFINRNGYDVLSVQHEYGIFGGEAGCYLMGLVREAKMPIVTTLHTVLREPSACQKAVMDELLELSERIVVMSRTAVGFLNDVHGVSPDKIDLIPHGIPAIPESAGLNLRSRLGIDGPMILTFGLLSPDKGIQYVIEAMPKIVEKHPGATYVVVGATHPKVRASSGEDYRQSLVALADDLGISSHVRFVDRFVAAEELIAYLSAMDYYVTPYLNHKQITSGTLAYSVGAGKAVISTPYWYAEEILSGGRGVLVPFKSAEAISDTVLDLQRNPDARQELGRKAAKYGMRMRWPKTARQYLSSFVRARWDCAERCRIFVRKPWVTIGSPTPHARFAALSGIVELTDEASRHEVSSDPTMNVQLPNESATFPDLSSETRY